MSRFYVGQRVKVIRVDQSFFRWLEGMEGVVNHLDCENCIGDSGLVGFLCAGKDDWCLPADHLSPITDSYDKVEWSECLWRPTRQEVTA